MRVILSWGMGVDSSAILHRWLDDPSSRSFPLSDLTVLTAQTGDEFFDTKTLAEDHLLPMLLRAGVRFVQVARANKSESMVVLGETASRIHIKGKYRLSDELLTAGTVPQVAKNKRRCSIHAKGWPLDAWIEADLKGEEFRHVIGFNAEEMVRVERDQSYSTVKRKSEYPLVDWGWDRATCEDYLADVMGEPWAKSCCCYCPFAAGKEPVLIRYRKHPDAAAFALFLEHMSLCLNPRMTLYSKKSLMEVIQKDRNQKALDEFNRLLGDSQYAVYHVRRRYTGKAKADRSVIPVAHGTRSEMERAIRRIARPELDEWGFLRAVTIPLDKRTYPALEETYVVGPDQVPAKSAPKFEEKWTAAHGRRTSSNPPPEEDDFGTREDEGREDQMDWECGMGDILPDV